MSEATQHARWPSRERRRARWGKDVEVGIFLVIVIVVGRTAARLNAKNALEHIAGYTIVAGIKGPHGWKGALTLFDRSLVAPSRRADQTAVESGFCRACRVSCRRSAHSDARWSEKSPCVARLPCARGRRHTTGSRAVPSDSDDRAASAAALLVETARPAACTRYGGSRRQTVA